MKKSAKQQLAALDARLGVGVGAKRERKRLAEIIRLEELDKKETLKKSNEKRN